jgi:translation initiation factor eIF-2B subunit epsilon
MAKQKAATTKADHNSNDFLDRKPHEQPLQAVLLAYDWTTSPGAYATNVSDPWRFRPVDLDRPLVNQPMIDYSIKYLVGQGAREIYVVCTTEAVEEYVQTSTSLLTTTTASNNNDGGPPKNNSNNHSTSTSTTTTIVVVRDPSVSNEGDALRELDKRNVIVSDPFILLRADTVCNCDLSMAMQSHRARHKADSSAIYTMVLKKFVSPPPATGRRDDLRVGLDPYQSNRILLYDNTETQKSVTVPCTFFAHHCRSLILRHDLTDPGLDLCSPDVLARFSDEFDYRDIRAQFITNSVAEEEEGLQNKIYAHIMDDGHDNHNHAYAYAAQCTDLYTYDRIARDILRRLVHPVTPETNVARSYMMQQRHFLYAETSGKTRVGRSSRVDGPGLLGRNCFIGEQCHIARSVLCDYCHVADQATIIDSHLWEGVQIETGASVYQSILAAGVVVLSGAVVSKGCVIGAGCIVGAHVTLPPYTRLTCTVERLDLDDGDDDWGDDEDDNDDNEDEDEDDDNEPVDSTAAKVADSPPVTDTDLVGPDGLGRRWKPPVEDVDDESSDNDDDDDLPVIPHATILQAQCPGFDGTIVQALRTAHQAEPLDDGLSEMDDDDESVLDGDDEDDDDFAVTFGGAAAPAIIGRQEGVDVVQDLKSICLEFDATGGGGPIENLAIELNSYKFSQNATYADCTMAALLAILDRMNITATVGDGKLVSDFKSLLIVWKPLLLKMGRAIGLDEEVAMVLALQRTALHDPNEHVRRKLTTGMAFRLLLQTLHDQDIVSEEAILSWAQANRHDGGEGRMLVDLPPIQDFLEWLEDDSDEDDDDDDNEEEED